LFVKENQETLSFNYAMGISPPRPISAKVFFASFFQPKMLTFLLDPVKTHLGSLDLMKPFYLALLILCLPLAPHARAAATIPFVGCIETGPTVDDGSWTAPVGKPLVSNLPPAIAAHLAVYASNWSAVLAPRGWACRSTVTPLKGVAMIVAPEVSTAGPMDILRGPAVIAWNDQSAATVAAYAGRYFPEHLAPLAANQTVDAAPSPGLMPRYATDMINYRGDLVLEYLTPARHAGLGSQTSQGGSLPSLPSYGLLALSDLPRGEGGIVNMTVRLPADLAYLHKAIIKAFAACMPNHNTLACESGGAFVRQGSPLDDGD